MSIPNYCAQPSLRFARERIVNPPLVQDKKGQSVNKAYEHHGGSWAFTMIHSVFQGPKWIITPEKTDKTSNKRPDLVVERLNDANTEAEHYLFMELKSSTGSDRFEEAVAQIVNQITETMEDGIEAYVVVQRGTKIGFFEYHNDISNLDEDGIPHFMGCVSLTQSYEIGGVLATVLPNPPPDLDLLYHNYTRLRKKTETRDEAAVYRTKCVFDICKHEKDIEFLFDHMVNQKPRSSV